MDNTTLQEMHYKSMYLKHLDDFTDDLTDYYPYDAWDIFSKLVELAVTGASLLSCAVLIYVIKKFDFLQTTINVYILNYAISSALFYVLIPLVELIIELYIYDYVHRKVLCSFDKMRNEAMLLSFTFAAALSVHWFILLLHVSWLEKYQKMQIYVVIVIYISYILQYILTCLPCFDVEFTFFTNMFIIEYLCFIALVAFINCYTYFKKGSQDCIRHHYALKISSYIVFSWVPLMILVFIFMNFHFRFHYLYYRIMELIIEIVYKLFIISIPIVIAVWLDSLDRNFNRAYRLVFSRKPEGYQADLNDGDESRLVENEGGQDTVDLA